MTNQTTWTNNVTLAVDGETRVTYLGDGQFNVASATSDATYRVTLQHVDGEPHTTCTCTAGSFGKRCWHAAEALLMAGELDAPVDESTDEPATVDAAALGQFLSNPQAIFETA